MVAIIASWLFDFAGRGITLVCTIPSGLPSFSLPTVSLSEIPPKTEIVDTAGGRSQIAQLSTVGLVLIVVLFFTKP